MINDNQDDEDFNVIEFSEHVEINEEEDGSKGTEEIGIEIEPEVEDDSININHDEDRNDSTLIDSDNEMFFEVDEIELDDLDDELLEPVLEVKQETISKELNQENLCQESERNQLKNNDKKQSYNQLQTIPMVNSKAPPPIKNGFDSWNQTKKFQQKPEFLQPHQKFSSQRNQGRNFSESNSNYKSFQV